MLDYRLGVSIKRSVYRCSITYEMYKRDVIDRETSSNFRYFSLLKAGIQHQFRNKNAMEDIAPISSKLLSL
jgi:hypothetical protein